MSLSVINGQKVANSAGLDLFSWQKEATRMIFSLVYIYFSLPFPFSSHYK